MPSTPASRHPLLAAQLRGLALLTLLPAAGCVSPLVARTAKFADVAAPALTQTRDSYTLAATVHASTSLARRVHSYDTTSITTPLTGSTFGTADDIKVRTDVLDLLTAYVATLAEVTGAKPITAIDEAAKASGPALGKLAGDNMAALAKAQSGTASTTAKTTTLSTPELQAVSAAIDAIDRLLVARARKRALPRILTDADGPITTLCGTLRQDFLPVGTPGLRDQVHADYERWISLEDSAVRDHPQAYSYPEKRTAIEHIFALQTQEHDAEEAFAKADKALADLATTHHALAQSAARGDAATFREQLSELALAARELAAFNTAATKSTGKTDGS